MPRYRFGLPGNSKQKMPFSTLRRNIETAGVTPYSRIAPLRRTAGGSAPCSACTRMVCIGHSDESSDFECLAGLARRGYTLGVDHLFYGLPSMGGGTNGIPTWQDRAATVKKLIDAGLNDRIFLANDWMFGVSIAPTGTIDGLNERNPLGNLFNVRNTIPYLRQIGVTDEQIRTITVTNPRNFFARG